jgi:hypothetical protein
VNDDWAHYERYRRAVREAEEDQRREYERQTCAICKAAGKVHSVHSEHAFFSLAKLRERASLYEGWERGICKQCGGVTEHKIGCPEMDRPR